MNTILGEIIGDIDVKVCKTPDGDLFFNLQADNETVLPVLYVIEDILLNY